LFGGFIRVLDKIRAAYGEIVNAEGIILLHFFLQNKSKKIKKFVSGTNVYVPALVALS